MCRQTPLTRSWRWRDTARWLRSPLPGGLKCRVWFSGFIRLNHGEKTLIISYVYIIVCIMIIIYIMITRFPLSLKICISAAVISFTSKSLYLTMIVILKLLSSDSDSCSVPHEKWSICIWKSSFLIKISKFLSVKAVIPLTVNKIASSGGLGPQNRSFPLYRSPLNTSFTVFSH